MAIVREAKASVSAFGATSTSSLPLMCLFGLSSDKEETKGCIKLFLLSTSTR